VYLSIERETKYIIYEVKCQNKVEFKKGTITMKKKMTNIVDNHRKRWGWQKKILFTVKARCLWTSPGIQSKLKAYIL
jgi:hypothetical protein